LGRIARLDELGADGVLGERLGHAGLKLGEASGPLLRGGLAGGFLALASCRLGGELLALLLLHGGLFLGLRHLLFNAARLAVSAEPAHHVNEGDKANGDNGDDTAHRRRLHGGELLRQEGKAGESGEDDKRDHGAMNNQTNLPATLDQDALLRKARAQLAAVGAKPGALAPIVATTMNLGTVLPELAAVDALVKQRQAKVQGHAKDAPDRAKILTNHDVMDFETYSHTIGNFDRLAKELRDQGKLAGLDTYAMRRVLTLPLKPRAYADSFAGWVAYLHDIDARFGDEIQALAKPSAFPEEGREEHTFIVAPTKWGKSELMKALAYHHVQRGNAAVVVLDPGGDLVKQIARWPELANSDRLIYVEPELKPDMAVGFNPLDGRGLDERARSHVAEMLGTAIGETVAELSANMTNLARHCATVLLGVPDATLYDLRLMVKPVVRGKAAGVRDKLKTPTPDDVRFDELIAITKAHPRRSVASFFQNEFVAEHYEGTRAALRARLTGLLSLIDVENMINGPATLHLETAIDARKIILVNLARFGQSGSTMVGQLLVGSIAGIVRRRAELPAGAPRVPIHLFIDETTTMVSEQMVRALAELRKFGLHLTLAQQVGGAGFTNEQRKVLFANTGVKFVGKTGDDLMNLADVSAAFARELPKIQRGQFWVQWGHSADLARLQVRSDLAGFAHAVDDAAWSACVDRQIAAWYRPAMVTPPPPAERPRRQK
jgi:hypothetical protein